MDHYRLNRTQIKLSLNNAGDVLTGLVWGMSMWGEWMIVTCFGFYKYEILKYQWCILQISVQPLIDYVTDKLMTQDLFVDVY